MHGKKSRKEKGKGKITNEKPISLFPLKPEEALKKFLEIPAEKKKRSTH
ncbi:MAG: hypothetical protein P4L35_15100 [Ignavibacteriaceae bacterium]|nr:hypothetical protein [Ignavibacteriaceae bacterium]